MKLEENPKLEQNPKLEENPKIEENPKSEQNGKIQKFLSLSEEKRDRIINAAMKEFSYGYKRASTDKIVKDAGISKGLLYHYFGTKENLFWFICTYGNDIGKSNYVDVINMGHRDILEIFWQRALLRRDMTDKYPHIYEFSNGAMAHLDDIPEGMLDFFIQEGEDNFQELIKVCDTSLFRDDIDPIAAMDLIFWSIEGFFDYSKMKSEDYEIFLEGLRVYLDTFRKCFYKQ